MPRETKEGERRVALTPRAVEELVAEGHDVQVETKAGVGAGFTDDDYRVAGANLVVARDAWDAELVVKVKEVQEADFKAMPKGAAVFSFHHLIAAPARARALAAHGASAIAWELVRDARGRFPLLAPMSVIAGRVSYGIAARHLGRKPARVLVLGAGPAASEAARAARNAGAQVTVLARRAREGVEAATPEAVERHALEADLVVAAVFNANEPTPKLLPRSLVRRMKPGAMIVDICIEEGGVAETSRRTTHAEPVFVEEGVVHYCVGNIPAAFPDEASVALSAAALPYVLDMARASVAAALLESRELRNAVLLWEGRATHAQVARETGLPYTPLTESLLAEST
ncbi:MAG TPA: NAD(P)-dependent oxidoreductase [Usitatibacter sp.]|nr:NAD(P)-dependent oxidoreductase [Usitatibacter sp.]